MNKNIFLLFTISLCFSCNGEKENNLQDNKKNNETVNKQKEFVDTKGKPNEILYSKVQGMMCEMGCGGTIRSKLKKNGGVSKVEFDFNDESKNQICRIYFNDKKTTKEEIVQLVESINEQQFSINIDSVGTIN